MAKNGWGRKRELEEGALCFAYVAIMCQVLCGQKDTVTVKHLLGERAWAFAEIVPLQ